MATPPGPVSYTHLDVYKRQIARKFGDKRRTQITGAEKDLNVEDLIADEDMVVTITHTG